MSTPQQPPINPLNWKVSIGTRQGGPFSRARIRAMVDAGRIGLSAFIRDADNISDWMEVQTVPWLVEEPEPACVRWCPECDSRVVVAHEADKQSIVRSRVSSICKVAG